MAATSQRIIPYLGYEDAGGAIEFLCRALGFTERFRYDMPDGRIGHAEVELEGNVLMLASTFPEMGLDSPRNLPAVHSQVKCLVDDVDSHYQRAQHEGATIGAPPDDQGYGERMYRVVDPEGHRWIFATPTDTFAEAAAAGDADS